MARPSTANRTVRRAAPAARSRVAGRPTDVGYSVDLDVRTAFDFVLSAHAHAWEGREEELLPEDRRWLAEARARVGQALSDPFVFGTTEAQGFVGELSYLLAERPDIRKAADVVRLLGETADEEIVHALLKELLDDEQLRPGLERALTGDAAAVGEFETAWTALHGDMPLEAILHDPAGSVGRLRSGLQAWLEPFVEIEDHVEQIIERDAEQRTADLRSLPPAEAIERTTGGFRWLAAPRVQRVILAPTYFGRPYNWLYGAANWRLIVYPVWDETLDEVDRLAPPHAAVRLYRALGDDTRLRILRMLIDQDLYLTEIAQRLELSKPTVKHHLTQLRTAGLVTVTEEGGLTYYSLRRSRVAEAGPELGRFLGI